MADPGNVHVVPLFVKAKTPEKLVAEMLKNNKRHGKQYQYDIIHDGKQWVAWYYQNLVDEMKLTSLTRGVKVK
jgi:hypothetical protein